MSTSNYTAESNYQKINRFFVEQIPHLEFPIIDARPNCVSVGPYRVITNGKQYEVWHSRSYIGDFHRRSWAVGYALSLYRGKQRYAAQLIDFNKQYGKLEEERRLFAYHIACCQRDAGMHDRDEDAPDREAILECRLSRVESEIIGLESRAETILKNIHNG
jgi:hypothetical protein